MKLLSILCLLLFVACSTASRVTQVKSELMRVEENSERGYFFPYYIYIPKSFVVQTKEKVPLLVIPNNTGTSSDDFSIHEKRVIRDMGRGSMDLAEKTGLPTLMPVFPRPHRVYTHSLSSETLAIREGPLKRLDLQLVAMVKDAQSLLKKRGFKLLDKFLLNGFSANGVFSNRFAFLHPKLLLGVASGGVNGIPMLPVAKHKGEELPFPIGTSNIEALTGHPFDLSSYRKVAQFIYMGAKDKNDTVPYRDAFSENEASLIVKVLSKKMMPNRWNLCMDIYREQKIKVKFKTYSEYGHEYTSRIRRDIAEFFRELY